MNMPAAVAAEFVPMSREDVEMLNSLRHCPYEARKKDPVGLLERRILRMPAAERAALEARWRIRRGPEFGDNLIFACERVFMGLR